MYELIHDILVRPPWNNLWCTSYSSVRTNTRFTVKSGRESLLSLEEESCLVQHIKVMASCGYGYSRSSEVVDMASNYAVALGKSVRTNTRFTVKSGRESLLSLEEESCLVRHIKVMASCGYGYSRSEVVDMASNYAVALGKRDRDHPFSLMWIHNFMTRWPDLKVRKPRSLELARAKATSEEAVSTYFKELDNILTKIDLKKSPERIYNIDEKGLELNYTPPKKVAGTDSGDAPPPAVTPGKGETVTVIGCGNALSQQIPPFFLFSLVSGCDRNCLQEVLQEQMEL